MLKIAVLAAIAALTLVASAEDEDKKWAGNLEMNGHKLATYKDFESKWKLVTVRYRQDSGEFRFIYANDKAWKVLDAGGTNYPDGAVFAKTGYQLSHDPAFTSSLIPSKVSRYQLMVRDKAKHASTGGWGYALFDATGHTFSGEPGQVAQACYACHQLVKDKGDVFATPIVRGISYFSGKPGQPAKGFSGSYETVEMEKLPKALAAYLPKGTAKIRSLTGALKAHLFQGTLDEIRPFLALEADRAKMPAALISQDGQRFSLVFASPESPDCTAAGGGQGHAMTAVMTVERNSSFSSALAYTPGDEFGGQPASQTFCFANGP